MSDERTLSDHDIDQEIRLLGQHGDPQDDMLVRIEHYERLVRTIQELREDRDEYRARWERSYFA